MSLSLEEALKAIELQLGIQPGKLNQLASEDAIGGYHTDASQQCWPIGSLWGVEGQILYALVRALKPLRVLELGTYHGCSATHLAAALKANGFGSLTCVDNGHDVHRAAIGGLIPDSLRDGITIIPQDMRDFLAETDDASYDLIFEDGLHDYPHVKDAWEQFPRVLTVGGVALSHDAMHEYVGADILRGITDAGIEGARTYLIPPADCGFALWRS